MPNICNNWYAVHTRNSAEFLAFGALAHKGYEVFLPTYPARSTPAAKRTERPLFPGYLFCRCSSDANGLIVTSPGVIRIVKFGKVAVPVSDEEIETIRRLVFSGLEIEPYVSFVAGAKVRVTAGPLAGIEGVCVSERGRTRVVASVSLLQRSVAVEVDRDDVEACSERRCESLQLAP
jgi:transcription antitermination factor NusG